MMNETLQTLLNRRSIRSYKGEQVSRDDLNQILKAGTYAASGSGKQSAVMVVVQDPEIIAKMSKMNAKVMGVTSDPFYGAPTVIVVFADKNVSTAVEDGSLVIGNLMNAAYSIGVSSCWIHRAREVFESEEGKKMMKGWGMDTEKYIGVRNCLLGYSDQEPTAAPRKENYIIRV